MISEVPDPRRGGTYLARAGHATRAALRAAAFRAALDGASPLHVRAAGTARFSRELPAFEDSLDQLALSTLRFVQYQALDTKELSDAGGFRLARAMDTNGSRSFA